MTQLKNLHTGPFTFVTGRNEDGSPKLEDLLPGETKNIDVDAESSQVTGLVSAGILEVGSTRAQHARKPAAE